MTATGKPSPLYEVHHDLGATFTEFAGWTMPVRYSSDLAEHRAVRQAAGMFDLSHMGEIEVTGSQAGQALDYAVVGTVSTLKPGKARYTMLCAEDGGVMDDLVVYRLAEDRFLVVANAANVTVVAEALTERAARFSGATVTDRSAEYALIAVQGPASPEIVRAVCDADVDGLKYYSAAPAQVTGHDVLLSRTGYTGEDGFELYCAPDHAAEVWAKLAEVGKPHDLLPAGLAARDTLRLEAGMPLYGNELSREVTPFDAGLGRIVKLDKEGGFVGREALAARAGRPDEKALIGLRGTGRRAPRAGYPVLGPDGPIGHVTSGALSPTLGYPVAMAYVDAGFREPGTELQVDVRGKQLPVEVVELPFYRRS
ncbi:glycine cleavage system aminomethyltransferase GcvT [Thermocrispum agreste]|uniref:glycine cleavage system aminomethyltransferase GcvT n=1 Tax=Thermocrispum agreste TaxID=37925 RepID=UPI00041999EC|nr:glycine cleavage system aminomethyltransferase GcvT [Thermocrispum agreste]